MNVPPAGDLQPPLMPAAAPPKSTNTLKWVLIGCGCLLFLGIAGFAGCGILTYVVLKKAVEEVAAPGRSYLAVDADVKAHFGELRNVQHVITNSRISRHNDQGHARIHYTFDCSKGSGVADVHLRYVGDHWEAVGCRVTVGNESVSTGQTAEPPDDDSDDDD